MSVLSLPISCAVLLKFGMNAGCSAGLPWLTRVKIALGAAKGLAFLHELKKPVIFRDLKAANILLDSVSNIRSLPSNFSCVDLWWLCLLFV